jgi:hypothetical protein
MREIDTNIILDASGIGIPEARILSFDFAQDGELVEPCLAT